LTDIVYIMYWIIIAFLVSFVMFDLPSCIVLIY